MYLLLTKR